MRLRTLAVIAAATTVLGALSRRAKTDISIPIELSDRGRLADLPHQMTTPGWRDILVRTYQEAMEDRLFAVSAGVAFYSLLAFVPALTVAISLYGIFGDPAKLAAFPETLSSMLPADAVKLVQDQATRLASEPRHQLTLKLAMGVAVALWGASAAVKGAFDALNVIYEEREKRSFLVLSATALAVTFFALLVLLFALSLIGASPTFLSLGPVTNQAVFIYGLVRWPAFFAVAVCAIAGLYWIGPSRRRPRFAWVLPGATVAALVWALGSAAFSWYASALANYSATYGSLSAVVVFITWLWLSAAVVLFGAQLNAELEHQTTRDTTVGHPKPLGLRGARMADTIGRSP